MPYLVDTCILLRAFDTASPQCRSIRRALQFLLETQEPLFVSVQNIAEYWNVATRPIANNGQGWQPTRVKQQVDLIERICVVVSENLWSYAIWKNLTAKYGVVGVAVHDARLVSTMLAHGITQVITLNERDFNRYQSEGIQAVVPERIVSTGQ
jgi:predicted nucleic acid-binding protein